MVDMGVGMEAVVAVTMKAAALAAAVVARAVAGRVGDNPVAEA